MEGPLQGALAGFGYETLDAVLLGQVRLPRQVGYSERLVQVADDPRGEF
ncbi:hypothetical protein [Cutibacterium modestum]|jgi:hypothetical protein|uniref:Uncharacterized protein n=2 Tax=Cutibacterium modestum TaxID=2559073 RepID=A0AAD1KS23_9ACTN|nr:hypothetical protein [Cutibacterium modestum]EFS74190.1 hypothetical protein HMPREF9621_01400 [Cutibacterium modestum HL037PA2]EFS92762.1 hypothetical protein HMPREF9607_00975 [Cutibacterium modestum HL044PA1]EFT15176.1 hypothetical protein HMPREF9622_01814 [Cutibacterium modestum HL037PA3]EGG26397.1 hypothetical protein PA08_2369 [Cutibacterium modestum P08]BCY26381.1 hypothetical protein KB1_23710 [Cutibacterium modestum]